jgi:hypothetical protein
VGVDKTNLVRIEFPLSYISSHACVPERGTSVCRSGGEGIIEQRFFKNVRDKFSDFTVSESKSKFGIWILEFRIFCFQGDIDHERD